MKKFPGLAVALLLAIAPAIASESEPDVMTKLFDAQLALAKRGDVSAYYHVGEMYEKGLGTAQNLDEARAWYAKAADKGLAMAHDKLAKWSRIEDERAKASERAAGRARQVEEARLANEARERAAREGAEERARMEAQANARAAQEATRLQAMQQAKAAAEAKARAEQEAKRQAEAAALARAEAAKKAANESRPAGQTKTTATSDGSAGGANGEPDGHAESKANASTDAKRVMSAGTPIQAIISRQAENDAKNDASGPPTAGAPDSRPSDEKRFSANPCNALTAKFLSTCR